MQFNKEAINPTIYPEQLKSGLTLTGKTLEHFGVENPNFKEPGVIKFVPESKIVSIEETNFKEENSFLKIIGPYSGELMDFLFEPRRYNTEDEKTIFIRSGFYGNLARIKGENIKDRHLVSGLETLLFEMVASGKLGINSNKIEIDNNSIKDQSMDDFRGFLDYLSTENILPNLPISPLQYFDDHLSSIDKTDIKLKIKGLCFSISHNEQDLFTTNYDHDQAIRLMIVNRMYPKFNQLMSKKYFWYPSEGVGNNGVINMENEIKDELENLINTVKNPDTLNLQRMYVSGELGFEFLNLKFRQLKQNEAISKEKLASELKEKMLGRNNPVDIDYSSYEFEDENKKVYEEKEMEEFEEVILKPRKRKNIKKQEI